MLQRIAIVGCGLIGNKRAAALRPGEQLVAVADLDLSRATSLAAKHPGCVATADWHDAIRPDVDLVIVATTNDQLAPVAQAAIEAGKHVLIEKPAARNAAELRPLLAAQQKCGVVVKVGFNLRFHPALLRARQIIDSGQLGPLLYLRGRYGHGGRLGMEAEWRGNPDIAGGGEMLDQGVHLIDLSRWFLGDFTGVTGTVARFFWNWRVEDNGFALLSTPAGQVAWLHASCTEWKNLFCLELFGRDGKLQIDGLGGSYGPEKLTRYRMLPQMGPPETHVEEFAAGDTSWRAEFEHLLQCIQTRTPPQSSLQDALAVLEIVERLYAQSPGSGARSADATMLP